jgi:hypothetical protein
MQSPLKIRLYGSFRLKRPSPGQKGVARYANGIFEKLKGLKKVNDFQYFYRRFLVFSLNLDPQDG